MKTIVTNKIIRFTMMLLLGISGSSAYAEDQVAATYLYHLSNFFGTVPYMAAVVRVDNTNKEVYVSSGSAVRVYNHSGMEIYDFSSNARVMNRINNDFAVDEEGVIFYLQYDSTPGSTAYTLTRRNYLMSPLSTIELTGLPQDLRRFAPTRIVYHQGLLYLGDLQGLLIVVTDRQGRYQRQFDLKEVLPKSTDSEDNEIGDFSVDRDGSVLLILPVTGYAMRATLDGRVEQIAKRGSGRGKLGVPSSVVVDAKGNYFVADKLKSTIMVFDRDFKCVSEFGGRGPYRGGITVPTSLAIDDRNRLYVSQLANQGVSVFQITDVLQ